MRSFFGLRHSPSASRSGKCVECACRMFDFATSWLTSLILTFAPRLFIIPSSTVTGTVNDPCVPEEFSPSKPVLQNLASQCQRRPPRRFSRYQMAAVRRGHDLTQSGRNTEKSIVLLRKKPGYRLANLKRQNGHALSEIRYRKNLIRPGGGQQWIRPIGCAISLAQMAIGLSCIQPRPCSVLIKPEVACRLVI